MFCIGRKEGKKERRKRTSISVRGRGSGWGAVAPQLWTNFQKSAFFGQKIAVSRAKMLANKGFVSGRPLDFFVPYAHENEVGIFLSTDAFRAKSTTMMS